MPSQPFGVLGLTVQGLGVDGVEGSLGGQGKDFQKRFKGPVTFCQSRLRIGCLELIHSPAATQSVKGLTGALPAFRFTRVYACRP